VVSVAYASAEYESTGERATDVEVVVTVEVETEVGPVTVAVVVVTGPVTVDTEVVGLNTVAVVVEEDTVITS